MKGVNTLVKRFNFTEIGVTCFHPIIVCHECGFMAKNINYVDTKPNAVQQVQGSAWRIQSTVYHTGCGFCCQVPSGGISNIEDGKFIICLTLSDRDKLTFIKAGLQALHLGFNASSVAVNDDVYGRVKKLFN